MTLEVGPRPGRTVGVGGMAMGEGWRLKYGMDLNMEGW